MNPQLNANQQFFMGALFFCYPPVCHMYKPIHIAAFSSCHLIPGIAQLVIGAFHQRSGCGFDSHLVAQKHFSKFDIKLEWETVYFL